MNDMYRRQVALLIRVMPLVFKIKDFAVHGGTAINLFHRNLPRYSVDIDVTYIPMEDRNTSLAKINSHLSALKTAIEKAVPGIRVIHKPDVWKLQCTKDGTTIKIEVNGTKRGILGDTEEDTALRKSQRGIWNELLCQYRVMEPTLWWKDCSCPQPSTSARPVRLQGHNF